MKLSNKAQNLYAIFTPKGKMLYRTIDRNMRLSWLNAMAIFLYWDKKKLKSMGYKCRQIKFIDQSKVKRQEKKK